MFAKNHENKKKFNQEHEPSYMYEKNLSKMTLPNEYFENQNQIQYKIKIIAFRYVAKNQFIS
jgi:hypothetical protein